MGDEAVDLRVHLQILFANLIKKFPLKIVESVKQNGRRHEKHVKISALNDVFVLEYVGLADSAWVVLH